MLNARIPSYCLSNQGTLKLPGVPGFYLMPVWCGAGTGALKDPLNLMGFFFLQWPSLQGRGRNYLLIALFGGLSAFLRGRDLNSLKLSKDRCARTWVSCCFGWNSWSVPEELCAYCCGCACQCEQCIQHDVSGNLCRAETHTHWMKPLDRVRYRSTNFVFTGLHVIQTTSLQSCIASGYVQKQCFKKFLEY